MAVNANASNPHYEPKQDACSEIKRGDLVLMDMWAKLDRPEAVYYDITWVGFCGEQPPAQVERVFTVVRDARDPRDRAGQGCGPQETRIAGLRGG